MKLYQRLMPTYNESEAKAIVRMVLEISFDMSLTDIICGKVNELSREDALYLEKIMERLEKGEPVQYVLGQADFSGRIFHVEPGVLIPRPETAELCDLIVRQNEKRQDDESTYHVLDVGTGSGCIAITLALGMSHWNVEAWDISEKALKVAKENAERLGAKINFVQKDVLNLSKVNPAKWDIIVSNPPYIAEKEKIDMESHVLDYEPSIALFVSDSDPICFYRAIAVYGVNALKSGGKLYFEINPIYVSDIKNMLKSLKYQHVIIQEDQFGKQRYCYATKV